MMAVLAVALAALGTAPSSTVISGTLPPQLGSITAIVWVRADASAQSGCEMVDATRWRCEVPPPSQGVVIMSGAAGVAYEVAGSGAPVQPGVQPGVQPRVQPRVQNWGRVIALTPPSGSDDLRDLTVTAWRPDRSAVRRQTERFYRIEDSATEVVRLSDTTFWVTGAGGDSDRSISIDGATVGSTDLPIATLAEGRPESPFPVVLSMPLSLIGRVQDNTLRDVAGAEVELFTPLEGTGTMLFHARAASDDTGGFVFDRLAPGPYLVVVTHPASGRGTLRLRSLADPAVVRLTAPLRAKGRVLRRQEPVVAARVRFVPAPDAFMTSTDPRDLITEDATTGNEGRFVLALPPKRAGSIQVTGPDGTSTRVPIPATASGQSTSSSIALGDITLPEPRHLTVRLPSNESCVMSAAGPLGALGLTIVRATGAGGVYWFDIPEAGEWALNAECAGVSSTVQPRIVTLPEEGPETTVDAQLSR